MQLLQTSLQSGLASISQYTMPHTLHGWEKKSSVRRGTEEVTSVCRGASEFPLEVLGSITLKTTHEGQQWVILHRRLPGSCHRRKSSERTKLVEIVSKDRHSKNTAQYLVSDKHEHPTRLDWVIRLGWKCLTWR
jgi:hypothetical protein